MRPLLLFAALSLAACATPAQRAEGMAAYINENYGPLCERLGYARGTDKHRDCMVSMFNADEIRAATAWNGGWPGPWWRPW